MLILEYKNSSNTYLIKLSQSKEYERWDIYSIEHIEKRMGNPTPYLNISASFLAQKPKVVYHDYLVGSLVVQKLSGKVVTHGLTSPVLDLIHSSSYNPIKDNFGKIENITLNTEYFSVTTKYVLNVETSKPITTLNYTTAEEKFREGFLKRRVRSINDLERLGHDLSFLKDKDRKYEIYHDKDKLYKHLKHEFMFYDWGSLDFESNGLNFYNLPDGHHYKSTITGTVLAWAPKQAIYIPNRHDVEEGGIINMLEEDMWEIISPYLKNKKWTVHNALMELKVCMDRGIFLNLHFDTMLGLFHLNPRVAKGSKSLKTNTLLRYGIHTFELSELLGKGNEDKFHIVTDQTLIKAYACPDGEFCLKMTHDIIKELPKNQMDVYQSDLDILRYLAKTEYHGVTLDSEYVKKLNDINNRDMQLIKGYIERFIGQNALIRQVRSKLRLSGKSDEEIQKELKELVNDQKFKNYSVEVDLEKDAKLSHAIYEQLGYPALVKQEKTGKPAINKSAYKKLLSFKDGKGKWLKKDIIGYAYEEGIATEKEAKLIDVDKFNEQRYSVMVLIKEWKRLYKLKTSFFANLISGDIDSHYFSSWSMHNSVTARIISAIQTLIKHMKKAVISPDGYYTVVFDASQIEYRYTYGESGNMEICEICNNPEEDLHRKVASMMYGIPIEDVNDTSRKNAKNCGFGSLYGISEYGLSEFLNCTTDEALVQMSKWASANYKEVAMLDISRDMATTELKDKPGFSVVMNKFNRRQYFNLSESTMSRLRRQGGNYPIQSGARDLFGIAFRRLNRRFEKEGIADKVRIVILVHDEFVMYVHKSISYRLIYRIICEEIMFNGKYYKGPKIYSSVMSEKEHPIYYWGIAVADNWYQGKIEKFEAPINFVHEEIERTDEYETPDNPTEYVFKRLKNYMSRRYFSYIKELQQDVSPNNVNLEQIENNFTNYFLKPRIHDYYEGLNFKQFVAEVLKENFKSDITINGELFSYSEDNEDNIEKELLSGIASEDNEFEELFFSQEAMESSNDTADFDDVKTYEDSSIKSGTPEVIKEINYSKLDKSKNINLLDYVSFKDTNIRLASYNEIRVVERDGYLLFNLSNMNNEEVSKFVNKIKEYKVSEDYEEKYIPKFILNNGKTLEAKYYLKDFNEFKLGRFTFFTQIVRKKNK